MSNSGNLLFEVRGYRWKRSQGDKAFSHVHTQWVKDRGGSVCTFEEAAVLKLLGTDNFSVTGGQR